MDEKTKQIIKIHDKIAEKYDEAFDDVLDELFMGEFLKYLEKGNKVLDVGCGTGSLTGYFFEKGIDIEGIDLSTKMLEVAKRNYPQISFKKMDMREMNYNDNSFDGVWSAYSMFHVDKEAFLKVLKKIRNILKPNGILGLVMQEGKGEVKIEEPLVPGEHIYLWLYSKEELRNILTENGFKVLSYKEKKPEVKGELPYKKMLFVVEVIKSS